MELMKDFDIRAEEVETYFSFAKEIDSIETHKIVKLSTIEGKSITIKRDLQKIMRSNCYLILYNLVEATIRNAIWAVYDTIEDNSIPYENLSESIKKIWLADRASELSEITSTTRLQSNIQTAIEDRLSSRGVKFSRTRISLSGNLDLAAIEKIINEYGFYGRLKADKTKLGKALLKVKHERNALAHGNKSFKQSAEIITIQDLFDIKDLILAYMGDITNNTTHFLETKKYLKKQSLAGIK
jgi:hypothetical protein